MNEFRQFYGNLIDVFGFGFEGIHDFYEFFGVGEVGVGVTVSEIFFADTIFQVFGFGGEQFSKDFGGVGSGYSVHGVLTELEIGSCEEGF